MKPKQPKSISYRTFPKQFAKLHPERTVAGGVKSRSQPQALRMAIYGAINELYATAHPYCDACHMIPGRTTQLHFRDDTHHKKGRDGLLLFDIRHFISVCGIAHVWIHEHPEEATKLGLLTPRNL